MEEKKISKAVIRRLPRYYRYLSTLKEEGITRISSKELSERMRITASQVRQDLNCFGGFGQQGYGYNVDSLYKEIANILGIDKNYQAIVIGAGNMGKSLAQYKNFSKRGFTITAIFDNNPDLIGTQIADLEVRDVALLETYMQENKVDVAMLTVPRKVAKEIAERVVALGVRGIWNFSPMGVLVSDKNVVVENVHLSDSLMVLGYRLSENRQE